MEAKVGVGTGRLLRRKGRKKESDCIREGKSHTDTRSPCEHIFKDIPEWYIFVCVFMTAQIHTCMRNVCACTYVTRCQRDNLKYYASRTVHFFFKKDFFILLCVYECFICLCVCAPCACLPQRPEEGAGSPEW